MLVEFYLMRLYCSDISVISDDGLEESLGNVEIKRRHVINLIKSNSVLRGLLLTLGSGELIDNNKRGSCF